MIRNTEYKNNPALSPSDLKTYCTDLNRFYNEKILGKERDTSTDKQRKGTEVGSMLDVLYTDYRNFHKYYISVADWKASGKIKDIVDSVFRKVTEQNEEEVSLKRLRELDVEPPLILELHNYDKFIINGIEETAFQPNWGMDSKIRAVLKDGKDYFEQKKLSLGRIMEPFEWFTLSMQKHEEAMKDKYVGKLSRIITGTEEVPGIEVLRQYPLYGTARVKDQTYNIKGLLDIAIINHANKSIQPYDIKTAKNMNMFHTNAKLSRYDIQGSMYDHLIRQVLLPKYVDYGLKDFKFLVVPHSENRTPEVIQLAPEDYIIGRCGSSNGTKIMGWEQILEMVAWNKEHDLWEHYPSFYNNKYITEVKLWEGSTITIADEPEFIMEDLFS